LVQKEQIITAFHTISIKKAIKIDYSYEPETNIHSLIYYYSNSTGVAFKLEKNNEKYTLLFSGSSKKHFCKGEPC
jgi:hypothetical protein